MIGSIPHTFDWGGILVPIEDYTVTIESISNFGFGGKATTTFKTGNLNVQISFNNYFVYTVINRPTVVYMNK